MLVVTLRQIERRRWVWRPSLTGFLKVMHKVIPQNRPFPFSAGPKQRNWLEFG
jgi:hypothetical protein